MRDALRCPAASLTPLELATEQALDAASLLACTSWVSERAALACPNEPLHLALERLRAALRRLDDEREAAGV